MEFPVSPRSSDITEREELPKRSKACDPTPSPAMANLQTSILDCEKSVFLIIIERYPPGN